MQMISKSAKAELRIWRETFPNAVIKEGQGNAQLTLKVVKRKECRRTIERSRERLGICKQRPIHDRDDKR